MVTIIIVDAATSALASAPVLKERFRLSEREAQVAFMLAQRLTNKEIARELGVTLKGAERHTENILEKLGISSRRNVAEAIRSCA